VLRLHNFAASSSNFEQGFNILDRIHFLDAGRIDIRKPETI
jgi:hypothetical protein